jgi:hypothetical protein
VKRVNPQDVLNVFCEQLSAPRNASCPSCGAALAYVEGRLLVFETEESFAISLGFCEHCDGLPVALGPVQ